MIPTTWEVEGNKRSTQTGSTNQQLPRSRTTMASHPTPTQAVGDKKNYTVAKMARTPRRASSNQTPNTTPRWVEPPSHQGSSTTPHAKIRFHAAPGPEKTHHPPPQQGGSHPERGGTTARRLSTHQTHRGTTSPTHRPKAPTHQHEIVGGSFFSHPFRKRLRGKGQPQKSPVAEKLFRGRRWASGEL